MITTPFEPLAGDTAIHLLASVINVRGERYATDVLDGCGRCMFAAGFERVRFYEISRETIPQMRSSPTVYLTWQDAREGHENNQQLGFSIPWDQITLSRQRADLDSGDLHIKSASDYGPDAGVVEDDWVKALGLSGKSWLNAPVYDSRRNLKGMLSADWHGPETLLTESMRSFVALLSTIIGAQLTAASPPIRNTLQSTLTYLHSSVGSTADLVHRAAVALQDELEIPSVSVFRLDWTCNELERSFFRILNRGSWPATPFEEQEEVIPVGSKLTGKSWVNDNYLRVFDYGSMKRTSPDLISEGSSTFHETHLVNVQGITHGAVGKRNRRYLFRLINSGQRPRLPFLEEDTLVRKFLDDLAPIVDSRVAAERAAVLSDLVTMMSSGSPSVRVATRIRSTLAELENVDRIIIVAHRPTGTMPHFVWGLSNSVVARLRPRLLEDKAYIKACDTRVPHCCQELPKSSAMHEAVQSVSSGSGAVLSFAFASGGTRGALILPLKTLPKMVRIETVVGTESLAFLSQLAATMGQSIESDFATTQAGAALGALSLVGHELDTPVAAIGSIARAAIQIGEGEVSRNARVLPSDTPKSYFDDLRARIHYHQDVLESAVKLGSLVGRQQDKRIIGIRRKHELRAVINSAIWRVRLEIGNGQVLAPRAIRFLSPEPRQSVPIVCERGLIEAGLANLYRNAAKYSREDGSGRADVITRLSEVTLDGRGSFIDVSVINFGTAIPQNQEEIIFEAFVRLGGEELDIARRGLGLGLYLARQVSRAHGGDVTLRAHEEVMPSKSRGSTLARYRTTFTMRLALGLAIGEYKYDVS